MSQNELYHYGVLGMKWGVRKDPKPTGSITKDGKYKASNGVVVGKSKNTGAAIGRKLTTSKVGGALSAVGSMSLNKSQRDRMKKERAALKEYRKVGGDKMLSSKNPEAYMKYTKEKQQAKIMRNVGVGSKVAGSIMNKSGKIMYEVYKDNSTPGKTAVINMLGYGSKATTAFGNAAIAGAYAKAYKANKEYKNA